MNPTHALIITGPSISDALIRSIEPELSAHGSTVLVRRGAGYWDAKAGTTQFGTYAEEAEYQGEIFDVRVDDVEQTRRALSELVAAHNADFALLEYDTLPFARGLVCLDCDSTLITGEVIEMLAAHAGREDEVAAVTERAMRGELDFEQSLRERVATLAGLDQSVIAEVAEAIELTPGVRGALRFLSSRGVRTAVVSGGFIQVITPLAERLNLDFVRANMLEIEDGKLTGKVVGEVVDRARKAELLREFAAEANIDMEHTVAIGDGANDIDMLNAAGMGIAFQAKPALREHADVEIDQPSLAGLPFIVLTVNHGLRDA